MLRTRFLHVCLDGKDFANFLIIINIPLHFTNHRLFVGIGVVLGWWSSEIDC